MKKIFSLLISLIVCVSLSAQFITNKKYNPELGIFLKDCQKSGISHALKSRSLQVSPSGSPTLRVTLYCNNQAEVKSQLQKMGAHFRKITSSVLTADVPVDQIESLSESQSVRRISALRKKHLHLVNARNTTSTNLVHEGASLETPYTGKGVVVGALDVGFQYNHAAFRVTPDSTRIVSAWDMNIMDSKPIYGSANIIAYGDDEIEQSHGTHVMGIMAGGRDLGSQQYYGMAPEASIVAVSGCYLTDDEILNTIALTKEVAESKGQPWVVNFSLGDNIHSHDGYDELSMTLDTLLMKGGHIVASAGNSGGDSIHASYLFTSQGESKYLLVDHLDDVVWIELLGKNNIDFDVNLLLYNTMSKTVTPLSEATWNASGSTLNGNYNPHTGKYEVQGMFNVSKLLRYASQRVVIEIKSKIANQFVDAWLEPGSATFMCPDKSKFMNPDVNNQICSPAITRSAIGVGAYNSSDTWTNIENVRYRYKNTTGVNNLSVFSSYGPTADETLLKPEVCGPGSPIGSSVKRYTSPFSNKSYITDEVKMGDSICAYGVMQGTSMSSPAVAGIIALWLQANPTLTHEQILEVLKETSIPFARQTASEWDYRYGYGKIDAYRGLKKVLSFPAGIAAPHNSETPVTLLKTSREWRVLFNSSENYADIKVYSIHGRKVKEWNLKHPARGQEEVISFYGMTKGVYVVNIKTPNSNISRKLLIE